MAQHLRLGEILIKQGLLTQRQLDEAIQLQKQKKGRIGEILIKQGIIKEADLAAALGEQMMIPYYSAAEQADLLVPNPEQGLQKLIPHEFAQKYLVLPLSKTMNSLTCAVFDPLDLITLDNLRKITACEINPVIATRSDILKAIQNFYSQSKEGDEARSSLLDEVVEKTYVSTMPEISSEAESLLGEDEAERSSGSEAQLSLDKLIAKAGEAPVVKLVDLIIRQAIDERASDIHIEPFKDKISIRYRIDGTLYNIPPPARHLHLPIISRIKILAKMDIAEKRLPQDGAITAKLENRTVDIRISTIPTVWGEKVVMRIIDKDAVKLELATLGFDTVQVELIRKALAKPYGLFFVTGPTGSGKSTTLYSALNETISPKKNIITVEDPVEFRLPGINQVNVKTDIGLTFASALRAFLRQDPDVIMVGEVRDLETAQICVRAALTGHFVLSTLHTNDASSAITRLMDIGVPNYLLTPSLVLIVAQRLARRLCPKCKEAYEPNPDHHAGIQFKSDLIYRPKGCDECNQSGFKGRMVLGEVMPVGDHLRNFIAKGANYNEIRDAARKEGMTTLYESGIKKVEDGLTSYEEVVSSTSI